MNSFDYVKEARAICDALGDNHSDWKVRIDDAIRGGSTGTEIVMAVRWNLAQLLKAETVIPADITARIKDYILKANQLLR